MKYCKRNYLCSDGTCMEDKMPCFTKECDQWQSVTQYDLIKAMDKNRFAEFIEKDMLELEGGCIKAYHKCEYTIMCGSCVNAPECIKKWLESEVKE